MLKHLRELTAINGVSGDESAVRTYIIEAIQKSGAAVSMHTDPLGNLIVEVVGQQRPAQKMMLEAHMDEVGLMVTGITEDGFLRFAEVGGIDEKVLAGRTVLVNGHTGVIGGRAAHHCSHEELNKPISKDSMLIDIGATCREEAAAVVSVGDRVIFDGEWRELHGDRFLSRALDDRAGCAILLSLLDEPLPYDVTLVFCVQEEVGLRGAAVAAQTVAPDISVTLDATTASDIAGVEKGQEVCFVGGGAVLSFMDKRTLYDYALYQHIRDLAAAHQIPVQAKSKVAGGNDAGAIQTAGKGVRVAAVSLPCRYIHSASCMLAHSDVDAMAKLIRLLAETLPGESA